MNARIRVAGPGDAGRICAVHRAAADARQVLRAALEAEASRLGLPRLVPDASLNAEAFYAHMGYERVHASEHRIAPGIALACVRMQKPLA